jgi:hypothetical protein
MQHRVTSVHQLRADNSGMRASVNGVPVIMRGPNAQVCIIIIIIMIVIRTMMMMIIIIPHSVVQVEKHSQRVPISQRGGEVIEPLVSTQWFVKMDDMAARALQVVRTGEVKILPERFEKTW